MRGSILRWLACLLLLVGAPDARGAETPLETVEHLIRRARVLLEAGGRFEAELLLGQALGVCEAGTEGAGCRALVHANLGYGYHRLSLAEPAARERWLEAAVGEYRAALAETPKDLATLENLIVALRELRRRREALAALEASEVAPPEEITSGFVRVPRYLPELFPLTPVEVRLILALGDLYAAEGKLAEALASYRRVGSGQEGGELAQRRILALLPRARPEAPEELYEACEGLLVRGLGALTAEAYLSVFQRSRGSRPELARAALRRWVDVAAAAGTLPAALARRPPTLDEEAYPFAAWLGRLAHDTEAASTVSPRGWSSEERHVAASALRAYARGALGRAEAERASRLYARAFELLPKASRYRKGGEIAPRSDLGLRIAVEALELLASRPELDPAGKLARRYEKRLPGWIETRKKRRRAAEADLLARLARLLADRPGTRRAGALDPRPLLERALEGQRLRPELRELLARLHRQAGAGTRALSQEKLAVEGYLDLDALEPAAALLAGIARRAGEESPPWLAGLGRIAQARQELATLEAPGALALGRRLLAAEEGAGRQAAELFGTVPPVLGAPFYRRQSFKVLSDLASRLAAEGEAELAARLAWQAVGELSSATALTSAGDLRRLEELHDRMTRRGWLAYPEEALVLGPEPLAPRPPGGVRQWSLMRPGGSEAVPVRLSGDLLLALDLARQLEGRVEAVGDLPIRIADGGVALLPGAEGPRAEQAAAVLAELGHAVTAIDSAGWLLGTAIDPSGALLAGVEVEVRSAEGEPLRTVRTDARGAFRIYGLPPGSYRLAFQQGGRLKASRTVQVALDRPAEPVLAELGTGRDLTEFAFLTPGVTIGGVWADGTMAGRGVYSGLNIDGTAGKDFFGSSASFSPSLSAAVSDLTTEPEPKVPTPAEWSGSLYGTLAPLGGEGLRVAPAAELPSGQEPLPLDRLRGLSEIRTQIGGPLVRERLWFGLAFETRKSEESATGGLPEDLRESRLWTRLPWNLTDRSQLTLHLRQEEDDARGRGAGIRRNAESVRAEERRLLRPRLEGAHVPGASFVLEWSTALEEEDLSLVPRGQVAAPRLGADGVWDGYRSLEREERREEAAIKGKFLRGSQEWSFGIRREEVESASLERRGELNLEILAGANLSSAFDVARFYRTGRSRVRVDSTALWLQDDVKLGRFAFFLGLRYEKARGRREGVRVEANPLLPVQLPAFTSAAGGRLEWESWLPRLGLSLQLADTRLWAYYGRFASRLDPELPRRADPAASAHLSFDLGREGFDRFVLLDSQGLDPLRPADPAGPHADAPDLGPGIFDHLELGFSRELGKHLELGASASYWRGSELWELRPLVRDSAGLVRPAVRGDYVSGGPIEASLPDGGTFGTELFHLRQGLSFTGGELLTNGDRERESFTVELSVRRKLAGRWGLEGSLRLYDSSWRIGPRFRLFDDPTAAVQTVDSLGVSSADLDGDQVLYGAASPGGDEAPLANYGWSFSVQSTVKIARRKSWGFDASVFLYGREGYPIPYLARVLGEDGRERLVRLTPETESFRLDDIFHLSLRLEKAFSRIFGQEDLEAAVYLDAVDLLDRTPVRERIAQLNGPQPNFLARTDTPRRFQLGLRLGWGK